MVSQSVNLSTYRDLPKKAGVHYVRGHNRLLNIDGKRYKLSDEFIDEIYIYCKDRDITTQEDIFIKAFMQYPHGANRQMLELPMYLYNPDNFPGIDRNAVLNYITTDCNGNQHFTEKFLYPYITILIDGNYYWIPQAYINKDNIVRIDNE